MGRDLRRLCSAASYLGRSRCAFRGHSACSWHRIYEISLKTLVLKEIRAHSQAVAQDENEVLDKLKQQILSESAAKQEDSKLEISRLRRRIGELEHMTAKLYEDKVSGTINSDTFAVLIQKSEQERIQKATRAAFRSPSSSRAC